MTNVARVDGKSAGVVRVARVASVARVVEDGRMAGWLRWRGW